MKITQSPRASANGVDARRIRAIVHGQRSITAETALLLSRFFGNSPQFWMGLQRQYDFETADDALSQKLSLVTPHLSSGRWLLGRQQPQQALLDQRAEVDGRCLGEIAIADEESSSMLRSNAASVRFAEVMKTDPRSPQRVAGA